MEPEGSLPFSQEPSAGSYPEPDQPNDVINETKLRGLSPQANYTDRATAACRRS
jgi:hypothetical protein